MAAYNYILLKTNISGIEVYGIAAVIKENEKEIIMESVSDVGINKYAVKMFVERCNEYQLSPCHLMDAVDDFLGEIY